MLNAEECAHGRRRSVDVGGLALALENQGLGHGWGSWDQVQQGETRCVRFLSARSPSLSTVPDMPNCSTKCTCTRSRPSLTVIPIRTHASAARFLHPCLVSPSSSPIEIPPETRKRLIRGLDSWHFEPHKLPDEEVLFCAQILFESLFQIENMQCDTGVSLSPSPCASLRFRRHLMRY